MSALKGLRAIPELLGQMELNELNRDAIVQIMRDLVGIVEWISEADDAMLTTLQDRTVARECSTLDMTLFREPTMGAHHGDIVFQALVRNFERAVVHLSRGVAASLQPVQEDGEAPVRGRADEVTTSPTGMRWLRGWVVENIEAEGRLVGGFALVASDGCNGGAAASITLEDFDAIVGPTDRRPTGFRVPVARDAVLSDDVRGLRVFGIARDGRAAALDRG